MRNCRLLTMQRDQALRKSKLAARGLSICSLRSICSCRGSGFIGRQLDCTKKNTRCRSLRRRLLEPEGAVQHQKVSQYCLTWPDNPAFELHKLVKLSTRALSHTGLCISIRTLRCKRAGRQHKRSSWIFRRASCHHIDAVQLGGRATTSSQATVHSHAVAVWAE